MSDFSKIRLAATLAEFAMYTTLMYAQGNASGYLYVYPSDPSAYPDQQGGVSNPTLQSILDNYQVVSYVKSFPGAVSQQLQNVFEIHCNEDVYALKTELENTGLFSLIELENYMQAVEAPLLDCPEPCPNPISVNDPNSGYELTLPGYPCAWTISQGDPSVVVAVVDTDFDLNNPELAGKIISKVGVPGDPECNHHGNIVAGTIVAIPNNGNEVAGVAPEARVAGYVVTTNYSFYIDQNGIMHCSCTGSPWGQTWQAYLDGRRIINVSWSGLGGTTTVVNAIKEMTENGTLLIVGAGNSDPGSQEHSAYYNIPGVLNVSSISSDGTLHVWVTYNQGVDLCAPGNGVRTIDYDFCGATNSSHAWGTSLSAPNAAGAAALILSVNPCLKPAEIENILKTTTCPIVNNQYPDWTGTGYLNAYAAVEKAKGSSGTISQSDTWSAENYVSADIIIPSGVTLTIHGTVKFSEGAGLVIQPGGQVDLYGTLTNSCMGPWEGVTVEGMAGESQYTAGKHGRLYTYDGAVIENAVTGVKLVDGGIIYGKGTAFKNDGTGVGYAPYSNYWPFQVPAGQFGQPRNHFGSLSNCTFLWDDDFSKASPIGSGVDMLQVRGLYYLCNINATRLFDFYVDSLGDIRSNQRAEFQLPDGTIVFRAAGNVFTKVNAPTGDFENKGPQVRYYHDGPPEKPLYYSGLVFSDVDPNPCESDYCLPPCREKDEWQALKSEYDTNHGLYLATLADMQAAQAAGNDALAEQKSNLAAAYRLRLDELSNALSLHMAFDTTTYSVDSIRVWWQKMESPVSDMVVARDYLAKDQNNEVFAIVDALPTKYSLSDGELADLAGYRAIMQIMQGETAVSLSENKIQQLLDYANNGQGISSAWAKNILTVKGYHFPPQPKALPGAGERSQLQIKGSGTKSDVYLVSPNPAKDQARFTRPDAQPANVSISVTDATGRIIWRSPDVAHSANITWQTGGVQSGIYFYTIQDANGLIQSGRIVIVK